MYRTYNGEVLWEGEGHIKEEGMESAYMTISHIIRGDGKCTSELCFHSIFNILVVASSVLRVHMR